MPCPCSSRRRVGQRHSAPIAQQQDLAQLGFQGAHLATQCRLGNVQHDSRLAEAAELGHVDEVFDLFQIHRSMLPRAMPICYSS
jgi:hypothetical protein